MTNTTITPAAVTQTTCPASAARRDGAPANTLSVGPKGTHAKRAVTILSIGLKS